MNKFFKFQQMKKKNKRLFKQEINTLITNIKKDLDTKKQIKLLTLKKKGKFSQDEVDYIMQVVNEYFIQNNLNNQGLKDYIKVKTFRLSKIWLTIAQQIQNQTPTIDKAIGVKIKKQIQSNISNNMEENREKLVNIQNEHYSYLEL
ncbi:unnamed protein product [Paramecium sonneborni]|uniref:Uncharacterized protein n=1 Tax=Paramecium sonneborni TaxID=65129 RepID=A0A8S1PSC3_9CILI|nr:unnamed protein product [Paramecium sonneborni]